MNAKPTRIIVVLYYTLVRSGSNAAGSVLRRASRRMRVLFVPLYLRTYSKDGVKATIGWFAVQLNLVDIFLLSIELRIHA